MNDVSMTYANDVGKMIFFSAMPIIGTDVIPEVSNEDDEVNSRFPSRDLEVMIEPTVPEDYDWDDGAVSQQHDGQVSHSKQKANIRWKQPSKSN